MNSIVFHTRNLVPKALVPRMRTTFNAMAKNHELYPDYEEKSAEAREDCAALEENLEEIALLENRLKQLRQARKQLFVRAVCSYQGLSGTVAARARGNQAVIEGAGFQTPRPLRNLGVMPLPQPEKVKMTSSTDAGKADVRWPCVAEKTFCEVDVNDGLEPDGWRSYDLAMKSQCSLTDLPSGKKTYVRLRAHGSKGRKSPWSQPVGVMVA
jgi:hypothetical protein